jgi:putative transposase
MVRAPPLVVTVRGMAYPSDLTDEQWALLEPVFNARGTRGRKHGDDLRMVVDAMLYIAQTGCQWRYLPESFGRWTRVWSQFAAGRATAPGPVCFPCCTR